MYLQNELFLIGVAQAIISRTVVGANILHRHLDGREGVRGETWGQEKSCLKCSCDLRDGGVVYLWNDMPEVGIDESP